MATCGDLDAALGPRWPAVAAIGVAEGLGVGSDDVLVRMEGKDYVMAEGDVVEFHVSRR